jgi:hypothetical protein
MSDLCPVYAPFFGVLVSCNYFCLSSLRRKVIHTQPIRTRMFSRAAPAPSFSPVSNTPRLHSPPCHVSQTPFLLVLHSRYGSEVCDYVSSAVLTGVVDIRGCSVVVSYGTAKSGVGISAMSVLRPDLMMRCVIPVIMAGILAVSIFPKDFWQEALVKTLVLKTDLLKYRSTGSSFQCSFRVIVSPFVMHANVICSRIVLLILYGSQHGDDALPGLHPARCWPISRSCGSRCWFRHWYRRRRWCPWNGATTTIVCWYGE